MSRFYNPDFRKTVIETVNLHNREETMVFLNMITEYNPSLAYDIFRLHNEVKKLDAQTRKANKYKVINEFPGSSP